MGRPAPGDLGMGVPALEGEHDGLAWRSAQAAQAASQLLALRGVLPDAPVIWSGDGAFAFSRSRAEAAAADRTRSMAGRAISIIHVEGFGFHGRHMSRSSGRRTSSSGSEAGKGRSADTARTIRMPRFHCPPAGQRRDRR